MAGKCVLSISLVVLFCASWLQSVEGCCLPCLSSRGSVGDCCASLCGDRQSKCPCNRERSHECTCCGRSCLDASLPRIQAAASLNLPQVYPQLYGGHYGPGDLRAYQQAYQPPYPHLYAHGYPYGYGAHLHSPYLHSGFSHECPEIKAKSCPICKPCPALEVDDDEPPPAPVSRRRYYSQPVSYGYGYQPTSYGYGYHPTSYGYRRYKPRRRMEPVSRSWNDDGSPLRLKCVLE
ncbi:uncharacterized protein LOC107044314 [Diachasma alloeum]|uniref:uncharacterized protein LOC107044314 n=1 Tax=Diachasma alloeum TaxID=454923 RepID=UPI00073826EB|nr:uncharacterized protein LOC107044314 [Diachasma alloeum]XP_015121630.1 uncharacterized protein LOC107044314 [Diachasma alloeum]